MRPFLIRVFISLVLRFKTRFICGGVGGAAGVVVGSGAGGDFVGYADVGWGYFGDDEIGRFFVRVLRVLTHVVADNQRHGREPSFLPRRAPLRVWSNMRESTADDVPQFQRMFRAFGCRNDDVLTQIALE